MKLHFLGAAQDVTGSCFLIEVDGHKILVECGMVQGSPKLETHNRDPFSFDPTEIAAVILTHAHIDHSGRLPLLVKRGYKGPIYTHRASADLCKILLLDSGYINQKDAEITNRKRQRAGKTQVEPIYTEVDAKEVLPLFKPLEYKQKTEILPGVQVQLQDAGHILGSAVVELWLNAAGCQRKIVFSGDLGHSGAPLLKDPSYLEAADLVLMESTYGDRNHRPWQETWDELGEVLQSAKRGRGNILIPAFAIGRTQELLYTFQQHLTEWGLNHWHIFLDSPMAIEATKTYAKHWDLYDAKAQRITKEKGSPYKLPNLHLSMTTADSMRVNQIDCGAIIIAGSGMCTGGRIKHHLKHNLWRRECHLIIVGYQSPGTLGRHIVDGAKSVKLWGEVVKVAAKVHTIGGLSAHADCEGLLKWYGSFTNHPQLALVHGEQHAMQRLADTLHQRYTIRPWTPKRNQVVDLKTMKLG